MRFGQPMDVHYLNGLLGAYQFAILLLLCPLAFRSQVGGQLEEQERAILMVVVMTVNGSRSLGR